MSQFVKINIPQSILKLPIVCEGNAQNENNKLVDIQNINLGSDYPLVPYYVGLVPSGKIDENGKNVPNHQVGFAHIFAYTAAEVHTIFQSNVRAAYAHYDSALESQDQAINRNLGAGAAGLLAAGFTAATVIKGAELTNALSCQKQLIPRQTQALCVSDFYPQYRNDLISDVCVGGAGIALLVTIAYQAYKAAQGKSAQATLDFVKASLAEGNATLCENVLKEYKTDMSYLPQSPQYK